MLSPLVDLAVRAAHHGDNCLALIRIMRSQRFAIVLTDRRLREAEEDLRAEVRTAVRYARQIVDREVA